MCAQLSITPFKSQAAGELAPVCKDRLQCFSQPASLIIAEHAAADGHQDQWPSLLTSIGMLTVTQKVEKTYLVHGSCSIVHGSCTDAALSRTAFQTFTIAVPLKVQNREAALKAYPREQ